MSGEQGLEDAVRLSGLSRSRFYRVAADWRTSPTLASLGAFAGVGALFDTGPTGTNVNDFRAILVR